MNSESKLPIYPAVNIEVDKNNEMHFGCKIRFNRDGAMRYVYFKTTHRTNGEWDTDSTIESVSRFHEEVYQILMRGHFDKSCDKYHGEVCEDTNTELERLNNNKIK